jgi:hypothetical protein
MKARWTLRNLPPKDHGQYGSVVGPLGDRHAGLGKGVKLSDFVLVAVAILAAVTAAAWPLATLGFGEHGFQVAAGWAARVAFIFFWLTYTSRPISSLLSFHNRRFERGFGLAFAAALLVHLVLVAWLFRISARQPLGNMGILYFGVGAVWTYTLALFSISPLRERANQRLLYFTRLFGTDYILLLFALDFVIDPIRNHGGYSAGYLPFAILTIAAPALRATAFIVRHTSALAPAARQRRV